MAKKVLIVDDDPDIVSYLEDVLADAGYDTVSARNGRHALAALEDERPDCVTLDLEMPDMTGPKFNRALAKSGRDIPVVVITAEYPGANNELMINLFSFVLPRSQFRIMLNDGSHR